MLCSLPIDQTQHLYCSRHASLPLDHRSGQLNVIGDAQGEVYSYIAEDPEGPGLESLVLSV